MNPQSGVLSLELATTRSRRVALSAPQQVSHGLSWNLPAPTFPALEQCGAEDLSRLRHAVHASLEAMERYGTKATYFVRDDLARREPSLISAIARCGHELALQSAISSSDLPLAELRERLRRGQDALQSAVSCRIGGVRLPMASESPWPVAELLAVVVQAGFRYDSSFVRNRRRVSAGAEAPDQPFWLLLEDHIRLAELPAWHAHAARSLCAPPLAIVPRTMLHWRLTRRTTQCRPVVLAFDLPDAIPRPRGRSNVADRPARIPRQLGELIERFPFNTCQHLASQPALFHAGSPFKLE